MAVPGHMSSFVGEVDPALEVGFLSLFGISESQLRDAAKAFAGIRANPIRSTRERCFLAHCHCERSEANPVPHEIASSPSAPRNDAGASRERTLAERPPHPDPLPLKGEREREHRAGVIASESEAIPCGTRLLRRLRLLAMTLWAVKPTAP